MSRKKSLLDGILYFINILFAIGLLLAYLAYYIPPRVFTIFSFAAIGYPVLVIVNLLFVIYWAIRLKRKILLSLFCIAIGYFHLPRMYQMGKPHREVNDDDRLKVMSYNVRLFNHYQWIDEPDVSDNIRRIINEEAPDVLLIQEYRGSGEKAPAEVDYPYSHFNLYRDGKAGSAIFSKFPITGSQIFEAEPDSMGSQRFHFADIEWQGQTIRFINVHLASVNLENKDYFLLENPEKEKDLQNGLQTIITNLHKAFLRREIQVQRLERVVSESPHPVVVTGDFNDVPQSYVYRRMDLELQDSFVKSGQGFGKTFNRSPLPLRIDYIFHDERLRSFNFRTIRKEFSDHYPIVTSLEWK